MKEYKRLTERDIDKETKHKLCIVLCDIRRRCLNPDYKYFYLYGERGIGVCKEWLGKEGQKNFREWAVNNGYKKGLTIDRIDNNKGYSPDNCRWVTAKEQSYNRRSNKLITIHGKTQTVTEWAKETGIPIGTLQNRLKYGWEEDRLLEPKQVHLKMSKHEMRVEILKLRKQLEEYQTKFENGTLIELPCKVGDKVYCIYQYEDFMGQIDEPFIEETTNIGFVAEEDKVKLIPKSFAERNDYWYKLKDCVLTLDQAEKKLKELQK